MPLSFAAKNSEAAELRRGNPDFQATVAAIFRCSCPLFSRCYVAVLPMMPIAKRKRRLPLQSNA
jgi:hypothetical protein